MHLKNTGVKIDQTITVIGGSGFVGSFLIKTLGIKYIHNLDKVQSPFYPDITKIGNILNPEELYIDKNTKTLVLLAAEHKDDVSPTSLYYDVNVQGTKNVLKAMDNAGIKNLIFTSSVAIYGLNKINPNENHPKDPFNHYGKSKWQAEQVIKEWYNNDPCGKSITIIRPTVIFGERNRGNVYNLLKQISSGKFIMIGKGKNKKSMAYVGNIVAFIKNIIEHSEPGFHIYNYADKPDFSMVELTRIIEEKMKIKLPNIKIPYLLGMIGGYGFDFISVLLGRKFSISSVRVKKFCATTQFDASKVRSVFKSPYTLEEGLNKTLEYEFINKQEDDILFYTE
jgi:nucleoside-diphosphate-sugar epimerase